MNKRVGYTRQYLSRTETLTKILHNSLSIIFSAAVSNVFGKQKLENRSNSRLNKEQLGKERKREIKANKFQPVCQQCPNVEAELIVVVKERCNKAHCRTHDAHSSANNGGFEQDRVG